MNNDDLATHLRSLPPELPHEHGRFDSVHGRVRRTHQRHLAGAVLGGVAALAIALPVVQQMWPEAAVPAGPSTTDSSEITDGSAQNTGFPWPEGVPPEDVMPGLAVEVSKTRPITTTHTGDATVALGPRPLETEEVTVQMECLSEGALTWPDGVVRECNQPDLESPVSSATNFGVILGQGQDTVTVTADEGTRWRITTAYVISEVSDWRVNANGQTYGVPNRNGLPDLVMALTTENEAGWAYADDVDAVGGFNSPRQAQSRLGPIPKTGTTVPVYESDGSTLIGEMETQPDKPSKLLPAP